MSGLSLMLACLRALDIVEVVVSLEGSSDSGDAEFDHFISRSGEAIYRLPKLTVDLSGTSLTDLINDVAREIPDGDWVNNEGGYGTVTFRPFEADPDDAVECDMVYRDESEDGDSDFEDEEEDPDVDSESGAEEDVAAIESLVPTIIFVEESKP
jgi:hypothetical protein